MKSFAVLAMVGAVVALPSPQGVTSAIAPQETTPQGCSENYDGTFAIAVANVTTTPSKRGLEARQDKTLRITLADGVLTDDQGRTGYIAANNQFQFDGPAQTGAIYTAGWSVCGNGTLALGDSAIFYQCLSGTFYNLYDESTGDQCSQIYIDIVPESGAATTGGASSSAPASSAATSSGAAASGAASQLSDGQVQATTSTPAVSQIGDGQIQATTAPVTQIDDGQIQATTAPITQIGDGQIQAPTSTPAVSQISDGQIQAPTNGTGSFATPTPTVIPYTGGASSQHVGILGLAAGLLVAMI